MRTDKNEQVILEFRRRKTRQLWAIAVTLFLLVALSWRQSHPGILFGEISSGAVLAGEIVVIAAFIIFSASNWRCPSCGRYLGGDIGRRRCGRCGAHLR